MATTAARFDSSGSVRIEVDGAGTGHAYDVDLKRAIQSLAALLARSVSEMEADQRPREVNVSCRLKAMPAGGFAVSLADAANFTVSVTWRAGEGPMLPAEAMAPIDEDGR